MTGRIVVGMDGSAQARAAMLLAAEEAMLRDATREVLVQHSGDADLLVVGTRGRNPAVTLLLGSVSEYCVQHARCPVMVTRAEPRHRADGVQADVAGTVSEATR